MTRFLEADLRSLSISFIVDAELRVGMAKSNYPLQHRSLLAFLQAIRIVHTNDRVVQAYVSTRAALEQAGQRIGENDLWIAATALADDAILVTHNTREFSRVDGLKVEDWLD